MKLSICIPNYNYARYLGRTLGSVLSQGEVDLEVVVADNQSTDESVAVLNALADPRVRVRVNRCNVGFARNLDRAAELATGDWMIMLSSDDMVRPGALVAYRDVIGKLGDAASESVLTSTLEVIDPEDRVTGRIGPDPELWRAADRDDHLSELAGAPVYRVAAGELLGRCLRTMKNPFNFAATAYPRALYEAVHGYGGARLINPDKWFHWRLLGVAGQALFVDTPHFAYRWHPANQTAQQARSGALKYLVDEYATVIEIEETLLKRAMVTRADLEKTFIERDVVRHGAATLARGNGGRARRILRFGEATFPELMRGDWAVFGLRLLLAIGTVGEWIAGVVLRRQQSLDRQPRPS
jgi:glycosyltransferase involved in cell wall biosynthesis